NGKIYDKFSEHIGFIPLVIISPSDSDLISEGSETRRKFIDQIISQLDSSYLNQLIKYQKVVTQRNSLLKYFAINMVFDKETLSIYNEQLDVLGNFIHQKRKEFIANFTPIFNEFYAVISGGNEQVNLVYESQLFDNDLLTLLQENLPKDRAVQ